MPAMKLSLSIFGFRGSSENTGPLTMTLASTPRIRMGAAIGMIVMPMILPMVISRCCMPSAVASIWIRPDKKSRIMDDSVLMQ